MFDLFNFPRLPAVGVDVMENGGSGQVVNQAAAVSDLAGMDASTLIPNFAVPNPDADWLYHAPCS